MKFFIFLMKEILESIIRNFRLLLNSTRKNELVKEISAQGLSYEINFYTKDECARLRNKIDSLIDMDSSNVWVDESGADHRIYFANDLDDEFNKFYEHPKIREVLTNYTGIINPSGMLLAARIDAKENNLGSGGGWHRDSPISHQFKAICYLSEVTTQTGPFQYIEGSHRKIDVLKAYFFNTFKIGQYRFSEEDIDNYLFKTKQKVTELTAPEGTIVFADTKGIHRGKPIEKGSRYVLFCYFWHGEIPNHFELLRQSK